MVVSGGLCIVVSVFMCLALYFASLFALVSPLKIVPMFLRVASKVSAGRHECVTLGTYAVTFVVLILFALSNEFLFRFFNVSAGKFQVIKNVVVFGVKCSVLRTRFARIGLGRARQGRCSGSVAVAPLTVPVLYNPKTVSDKVALVRSTSRCAFGVMLLNMVTLIYVLSFFVLCTSARLLGVLKRAKGGIVVELVKLVLVIVTIRYFVDKVHPMLVRVLGRTRTYSWEERVV